MATETKAGHVRVNLRRSVSQRVGGTTGETYGPGENVEIPESLALSLGLSARGTYRPVAEVEVAEGEDGGPRLVGGQKGTQAQDEDNEPDDTFKGMTKADLEAEAGIRNLGQAKRLDGKDGAPRVEDLKAALRTHEAAKAPATPATGTGEGGAAGGEGGTGDTPQA